MNTEQELEKVLAIVEFSASMNIVLTSLEIRGLAGMKPAKATSVIGQLTSGGKIRYDLETRGFVPCNP